MSSGFERYKNKAIIIIIIIIIFIIIIIIIIDIDAILNRSNYLSFFLVQDKQRKIVCSDG